MTDPGTLRLPLRLALLGAATASLLWLVALMLYAAMPTAAGAPALTWDGILLGFLASVGVFGGLGYALGLASR